MPSCRSELVLCFLAVSNRINCGSVLNVGMVMMSDELLITTGATINSH